MTKRIEVGREVKPTSSPPIVEPPAVKPQVRVLTRADVIISDALEVVAHEINLFRKARVRALEEGNEAPMSDNEAKTFGRHVRALYTLRALERDERENPYAGLSDEDLRRIAREALGQMEGK